MVATPMKILIFDSQGLSYIFICFHFISVLIKYALIHDEVSTLVQFGIGSIRPSICAYSYSRFFVHYKCCKFKMIVGLPLLEELWVLLVERAVRAKILVLPM